jgi:hypothetical protein
VKKELAITPLLSVYCLVEEKQIYENFKASQFFPALSLNTFAKYITCYDQYEAIAEFIKEI